ncbi:hypothetical protein GLAREA_07406 [Glarea lozoyensis ATCC 20868]|uniref:Uncharacterized protein n=1 Tax=Glarea lozoyensis (strain ATCC 20868 / MF5171) TaxID=1116229 RepID=S3E1C1_GLAL2|nr:uncharacterized protein GLAREA_07406 [Glarea lozoyensis ATCC 20868]EPE32273.1 hypothetical protein GLAREA_07406 [Glarea lozoyensis ATCC 20868]
MTATHGLQSSNHPAPGSATMGTYQEATSQSGASGRGSSTTSREIAPAGPVPTQNYRHPSYCPVPGYSSFKLDNYEHQANTTAAHSNIVQKPDALNNYEQSNTAVVSTRLNSLGQPVASYGNFGGHGPSGDMTAPQSQGGRTTGYVGNYSAQSGSSVSSFT